MKRMDGRQLLRWLRKKRKRKQALDKLIVRGDPETEKLLEVCEHVIRSGAGKRETDAA